ncbi:hypothetical protein [Pseudarthrobacter sp. N5]|uniref:hypothetical protein n=1 Tax=Pseudarthrobacter sp. N5 TaxID=3418416 RepID=UPI003CE84F61
MANPARERPSEHSEGLITLLAVAAGKRGGDIFVTALEAISKLSDGAAMKFVAHGMGLITLEVPRLTRNAESGAASVGKLRECSARSRRPPRACFEAA